MAPLDSKRRTADEPIPPHVQQAWVMRRVLWRLVLLISALLALAVAADGYIIPPGLPAATDAFLRSGPLGGAAGAVCASLLIVLSGLIPAAMVAGRRAALLRSAAPAAKATRLGWLGRHLAGPARGAWPQGLVIAALATGALAAIWYLGFAQAWPVRETSQPAAVGGVLLALAFPLLIIERYFARLLPGILPETADLARLLNVPVVALLVGGALDAGAGLGMPAATVAWLESALAIFIAVLAGERLACGLAVSLAPGKSPDRARAATGSVIARLLRPSAYSPASVAGSLRDLFGLDFTRSWAIRFAGAALPPVLFGAVALSWFLSGVISVGVNERGQYERFGKAADILPSGLHLVLPWPFGAVRIVEHGVIHSVAIGDAETDMAVAPGEFVAHADNGPVLAEDIPPPSANRLWDQPRASDVSFVIASASADRQSFEMISADLRVLFRVGLDDESVRQAAYRTGDPSGLVRTLAREQFAQFCATRTLADILGADRESIANELRQALTARLVALRTGIEVVAMIVESAQPPAGAAGAYHHVQAAQIDAITAIASERGRAVAASSVSARDAYEMLARANGDAEEAIAAAKSQLTGFEADNRAWRAGGRAFILERYFANLEAALAKTDLEIFDDRLDSDNQSTLDLRPIAPGPDTTRSKEPHR